MRIRIEKTNKSVLYVTVGYASYEEQYFAFKFLSLRLVQLGKVFHLEINIAKRTTNV